MIWVVIAFNAVLTGVAFCVELWWFRVKMRHEKAMLALDVSYVLVHEASLAKNAGDLRTAERLMELADMLETPRRITALAESAKRESESWRATRAERRQKREAPREKAN